MTKQKAGRRSCRECGHPLIFVTDSKGAIHPLDSTAPTWRIETDMTGAEVAVRADALVSHWATCAKRDEVKARLQGQRS